MSDPIMQALRGEITWREADQLYHAAMAADAPHHVLDRAFGRAPDHEDDDAEAADDAECGHCEQPSTIGCCQCGAPACEGHSEPCHGCELMYCDDCITMDDEGQGWCGDCAVEASAA